MSSVLLFCAIAWRFLVSAFHSLPFIVCIIKNSQFLLISNETEFQLLAFTRIFDGGQQGVC